MITWFLYETCSIIRRDVINNNWLEEFVETPIYTDIPCYIRNVKWDITSSVLEKNETDKVYVTIDYIHTWIKVWDIINIWNLYQIIEIRNYSMIWDWNIKLICTKI